MPMTYKFIFPSFFQTRMFYGILISHMHVSCLVHIIPLYLIILNLKFASPCITIQFKQTNQLDATIAGPRGCAV
jgi:ABC-type glycerol-3-phosphate transport system permease component